MSVDTSAPIRVQVAQQLRKDLAAWDIRPYPYIPPNVTTKKPVVAVWRPDLNPGATSLVLRHNVTVNLYGSKTAGEAVEMELDGLLDQVLLSLQRMTNLTWEAASRTTWTGNVSGWQITGYMEPLNNYASTVRQESETTDA
jgi:hypothetical protein